MNALTRFRGAEVEEIACKSLLNAVHGMPFAWSINPYQGCYHQCVFCYAATGSRTASWRNSRGLRSRTKWSW